jgi:hypothetical protein
MGVGKSKNSNNAFCDEDDNKIVDIPNIECFCIKNNNYNNILIFIFFFTISFIVGINILRKR